VARASSTSRPEELDADAAQLPAEHGTDFVFASYSEQRGFVGASLLLACICSFSGGLANRHGRTRPLSAIVAGGIVFALLFQIFVNVGMTMGIARSRVSRCRS